MLFRLTHFMRSRPRLPSRNAKISMWSYIPSLDAAQVGGLSLGACSLMNLATALFNLKQAKKQDERTKRENELAKEKEEQYRIQLEHEKKLFWDQKAEFSAQLARLTPPPGERRFSPNMTAMEFAESREVYGEIPLSVNYESPLLEQIAHLNSPEQEKELISNELSKLTDDELSNQCNDSIDNGSNPLLVAIKFHRVELFLHLLNRIDPSIRDMNGRNAFHYAARYENILALKKLLERDKDDAYKLIMDKNKFGRVPAHCVAKSERGLQVLKLMCEITTDFINMPGGRTGATPLSWALTSHQFENAKFLIEHGANCSQIDYFDTSIMLKATMTGNLEMCTMVAENGGSSDLLCEDHMGLSAKKHAESMKKLYPDDLNWHYISSYFDEKLADLKNPNEQCFDGQTAGPN